VTQFIVGREGGIGLPVKVVIQARFNPNLKSSWFTSVMQIVSNLTMITVMLTGAALIREREQGTVEHLLVMPVVPAEIMLSKILANGVVIVAAAGLSLLFVVQWWLKCRLPDRFCCFWAARAFTCSRSRRLALLWVRSPPRWLSSVCCQSPCCW
jgi:ABC-2 type transport system permease protein